jgi:hypothetical protein
VVLAKAAQEHRFDRRVLVKGVGAFSVRDRVKVAAVFVHRDLVKTAAAFALNVPVDRVKMVAAFAPNDPAAQVRMVVESVRIGRIAPATGGRIVSAQL